MKSEELIKKINGMKKIIKDLKWSDLRDDNLVIAITQLKILLEDMFSVMKIRKGTEMPYIIREK